MGCSKELSLATRTQDSVMLVLKPLLCEVGVASVPRGASGRVWVRILLLRGLWVRSCLTTTPLHLLIF